MFGNFLCAKPSVAALILASFATVVAPVPAAAGETPPRAQNALYFDPSDGNQRINLAGRLRMLSQRIAGMACNQAAGIEAEKSKTNLLSAIAEYESILNGLEYGDLSLNIAGPENSRGILRGIHTVQDRWQGVSMMAKAVLEGDVSDQTVATLAEDTSLLLADAQRLVVRVVEFHYDRVNTRHSVAMTIDFAGRQRMLAQKISKNLCLIHMESGSEAAIEDLRLAHNLFDATLQALLTGMPTVGVSPPPDATVAEGLATVVATWSALEPQVAQALDGARFDDVTRAQLFHDLNRLTAEMNAAVQLYVAASRKQI